MTRAHFLALCLITGALAQSTLAHENHGHSNPSMLESPSASMATKMDLYKTETCGCCQLWQQHMETAGYSLTVFHPENINAIKQQFKIAPSYQSCHTGVKDGFVFEGHIPAKFVQQFLRSPPEGAIGLAVPGMPLGSPGMEVGERFTPYDILLLKDDGSSEVFASIKSMEDQY